MGGNEPAGGPLSAEWQRLLLNPEECRAFLAELRAHVPPRVYLPMESQITTMQRCCERLLAPHATMGELRRILAEGEEELEWLRKRRCARQ